MKAIGRSEKGDCRPPSTSRSASPTCLRPPHRSRRRVHLRTHADEPGLGHRRAVRDDGVRTVALMENSGAHSVTLAGSGRGAR
jgi:hypothetical protein